MRVTRGATEQTAGNDTPQPGAESRRLAEDARREKNWKRWGPYLSERQWGTVREDYSEWGTCWDYLPHDHARSRAYRWGEDGLLGLTDRECRLCFALSLWNGKDPILKERLFGLTGPEGNHGEDVKECYFYLDATPTHSYLKALYKYPQREYPYAWLVEENRRRGKGDSEFELVDTGIFDDGRYFDVTAEYAKAAPEDILIRLTIANRGAEAASLHVLPTLWFRNTWSWGRTGEGYWPKPRLARAGDGAIVAEHASLGRYRLVADGEPEPMGQGRVPRLRRPRAGRRREPRGRGHEGRLPLPARGPGGPRGDAPAAPHRRRGGRRPRPEPRLRGSHPRGGCVLRAPHPRDARRGRAGHRPSGVREPALVEEVLPLRRQGLARGRPGAAAAAPEPPPGSEPRLAPPLQPRRHLDARGLGVPVVRRLGPRLPHDPVRAHRPVLRQGAARPLHARVVHAPERAAPGVRMGVLGREPARARVVRVARLQDDRAARRARPALPLAPLPEALPQLHLVGEPQGQRGEPPLRRWLPRPRQRRRVRPLPPAARGRHARAGRRHRVDGLLLRDPARDGARAGARGPRLRGHGLQVLRALRCHRRRHERVRRLGPLVPRRRLLLRPAADQRARRA